MVDKKTLIIRSLSEMNISMLEILLDDAKTYQGAAKVVFLEKLDEAFEQFKKSKNTQLLPFSGICKSKECENKGCKGMSFLGNRSNTSIDLIFDELENDFKDIYQCSNFKIHDKSVNSNKKFKVDIKEDEKLYFNPNPERQYIFQECATALDEIIKSNTDILTKDKLLKWIDDYYWLREELKNNTYFLPFIYRSIDNFRDLYNDLNNVAKHIQFENQSFDALVNFQKVDFSNETKLLNWLVNYENLRSDLSTIHHPFDDNGVIKMNYLRIHKQPKIRIDLNEFNNIIQFKSDFDKHYWSMHSKYKIYTDDESRKLNPKSDDYKNRFSLKYQLQKRGIQM